MKLWQSLKKYLKNSVNLFGCQRTSPIQSQNVTLVLRLKEGQLALFFVECKEKNIFCMLRQKQTAYYTLHYAFFCFLRKKLDQKREVALLTVL